MSPIIYIVNSGDSVLMVSSSSGKNIEFKLKVRKSSRNNYTTCSRCIHLQYASATNGYGLNSLNMG